MQEPAVAAALPNGLLLSVERMIQTRWDAIKIATVSVPDSSAELVAQKLLALRALNDFAQTTVGGLVNASDGQGEHSEIKKQLIDLQVRWNLKITDAVNALLEHAKELHGGSEFVSSRDALVVK